VSPLSPALTPAEAEDRRRRIGELRRRIAAGVYSVPAEAVADAMLRHIRRMQPDR
jgi:anti-sigma28 factor (negative regulator of flagellin synthesis)